ncbi:MAG TPA: helix-turn-helix domain-containing protein, partial [Acidimicrobiales bacterium]
MSKSARSTPWREWRRESARAAILDAAWDAVREDGLAALSLRDLARRAGITTPTVYAYFDSKDDIYDGMFGQAADQFAACVEAPYEPVDPQSALVVRARRFADFCLADLTRYQLLFQRSV